jgi:hypothetical protein
MQGLGLQAEAAFQAFYAMWKQLTSKPVMAFPKANQQYALIRDAAMGMADTPVRLGAILTQVDKDRNFYAIFLCITTVEGPWEKLFTISPGSSRRRLGHGLL